MQKDCQFPDDESGDTAVLEACRQKAEKIKALVGENDGKMALSIKGYTIPPQIVALAKTVTVEELTQLIALIQSIE